ncbi:MAG TPA: hypothetical protein VEB19_05435 [Gemmatimonadaceae bacterium]|nr:hypothetical protein [Gemmatimonadaceae bacterium]
MTPQKPQVGTSGTEASRRCSIRLLSQGSSLVIAQGSGEGTPTIKKKNAAPQPAMPGLRKTQFLRVLPPIKDE